MQISFSFEVALEGKDDCVVYTANIIMSWLALSQVMILLKCIILTHSTLQFADYY